MKRPLRTAILASLLAAACSPASDKPTTATSAPAAAPPSAPAAIMPFTPSSDVHPFVIGEFQAAAVRDGAGTAPNDNKTLAINKSKKDVADLLKANDLPTDVISLSIQPLLVKTTNKILLFDTGAAGMMGPGAGKLASSLASAGVDPGGVSDIFISHGHSDHIGGLVNAQGALSFPNAVIHVSAAEWASIKKDKQAAAIVAAVTPKIAEFQPDADILPGVVRAVDIKGHTPGHSGYLITSGSQSLLYQGDVMHHFIISVQQPDWTIAYDGDPTMAQATRKAMLEKWSASGQRIYAVHFPFPGLGKYQKKGAGFVWVAEQ